MIKKPWCMAYTSYMKDKKCKPFKLAQNSPENWRANMALAYFWNLGLDSGHEKPQDKESQKFGLWFFGNLLKKHGGIKTKALIIQYHRQNGYRGIEYSPRNMATQMKSLKKPILESRTGALYDV